MAAATKVCVWASLGSFCVGSGGLQAARGIDGKPVEFEWNVFTRHTTIQILKEIQNRMAVRQTSPEDFEDRIIFISMVN